MHSDRYRLRTEGTTYRGTPFSRRPAPGIMAAFAAIAAAITVLLGEVDVAAALRRRDPARAPAIQGGHTRLRPEGSA